MLCFKTKTSNFREYFDESRAGISVGTEIETQNFCVVETYLKDSTRHSIKLFIVYLMTLSLTQNMMK